jgi:micrococcal nuclease
VDGDTFDLDVDLGFHLRAVLRFRLRGVNTPELDSKDAAERARAEDAREVVANLLPPGAEFRVATHKTDSFGRWLADVTIPEPAPGEESDLASELLRRGLAVPYRR